MQTVGLQTQQTHTPATGETKNRSIRLSIAFEKGATNRKPATSASPSVSKPWDWGQGEKKDLRGFARAEVGGDVSGEIAEEVVDFARLGVGGEASDEEGAELVPRLDGLLRAVVVGAVSGRGCRRRRRRVGVAVRAVRGGARRGRRRRVGRRGVVEVRGGHAARIARGRAGGGGGGGYGLPRRRRGWSRGRALVTGEGAADGCFFWVLPWGGFGVRFDILGPKISFFRHVWISLQDF